MFLLLGIPVRILILQVHAGERLCSGGLYSNRLGEVTPRIYGHLLKLFLITLVTVLEHLDQLLIAFAASHSLLKHLVAQKICHWTRPVWL